MDTKIANPSYSWLSAISSDPSATRWIGSIIGAAACEFAGSGGSGGPNDGVLVELRGPLGSGKTTLSQGIGAGMGLEERVTSPTFALVHDYGSTHGSPAFVHVDLYRIGTADEVRELALAEALDSGGLVAVEWPERAGALLSEAAQDLLTIVIGAVDVQGALVESDGSDSGELEHEPRRLDVTARGRTAMRILSALSEAIVAIGSRTGVRLASTER